MDFFHNPYRCGPLRVGRYDLTYTLRYQQHKVFTCFRLLVAITSAYLPVGRNVEFTQSPPLFFATFESYDFRTKFKFIDWHGKQQPIVWIFCCESEVNLI